MNRKVLVISLALVVPVLVTAVVLTVFRPAKLRGSVIDPALPAPPISLADQNGQPFRLDSLKGKVTLVYFGYTNCPDACPLAMAKLRQVFDGLGGQATKARVILVTTDPARDHPSRLKSYLANFSPGFIGLTGTPAELKKTWSAYGVVVLDNGETHSSRIYVLDRQSRLRETLPSETDAATIAADVRLLLEDD